MTEEFGSSVIVIYSCLLVLLRPNSNLCFIPQHLEASIWQTLDGLTLCVYIIVLSHVLMGDRHYKIFQASLLYTAPSSMKSHLKAFSNFSFLKLLSLPLQISGIPGSCQNPVRWAGLRTIVRQMDNRRAHFVSSLGIRVLHFLFSFTWKWMPHIFCW